MITISKDGDLVTLINVFSCEPENLQALIDAWIRATDETLGKLPGIVSAALHRSKDGTRVVNYAQWKSAEAWDNLVELRKTNYFKDMGKFAKPDAHLYEVCYVLDKTSQSP
jgi:quinol monooxygenase YgiN